MRTDKVDYHCFVLKLFYEEKKFNYASTKEILFIELLFYFRGWFCGDDEVDEDDDDDFVELISNQKQKVKGK